MPTKKKRHTCTQCKRKLVETKMKEIYRSRGRRFLTNYGTWICLTCLDTNKKDSVI